MSRLEPGLRVALRDLATGLRRLDVRFCVIGALVPELLLEGGSARMTHDADVTVVLDDLAAFDQLKLDLSQFGFVAGGRPHQLRHRDGGLVDILPYSDGVAPNERLELSRDVVLNMAGFRHVVPSAVNVQVDGELTVPVTPVPLFVLLKLVAFSDRRAPKDLATVDHCLQRYREGDDVRYGLDYDGEGVPIGYTSAYLVGLESQEFLDERVNSSVRPVLETLESVDGTAVSMVVRESGRSLLEDRYRTAVTERFRWFRRGAQL